MTALRTGLAGVVLSAACLTPLAHASLFDDNEARRAILELRQKLDDNAKARQSDTARLDDENVRLRKALLDLQAQIDQMRQEVARLRGLDEQRTKELGDLQKRQREVALNVDDRLRRFEPVRVSLDGQEFAADPAEKAEYEAAMATFRKGEFAAAQQAFLAFAKRYPASGYFPNALYWLGNAQFASRDFKEATANFRQLVRQFPDHARSPEAMLSAANAQLELKDARAARKTLEDLVKAYPQSEAANAAKERLARMK